MSLPFFQRYGAQTPFRRTIFRLREKYVLLLSVIVFCGILYSAFTFLPDGSRLDAAGDFKKKYPSLGKEVMDIVKNPQRLVVPPFRMDNDSLGYRPFQHGHDADSDPHRRLDHQRYRNRMSEDEALAQVKAPDLKLQQKAAISGSFGKVATVELKPDKGDIMQKRQEKIKEMIMWAWDGYAQYGWGANEVRPVSKVGHTASIFGSGNIGATIVDAMDTLYIAGLLSRFDAGKKWIELSLNWNEVRGDLSVFETNIRYVGGFLSCFALTKDELFKQKAIEIADLLLPAFDTPTGIPLAMVNLRTKQGKNWGWASGGGSILSEFGTLHLEFEYLSEISGNPIYLEKVKKIREVVKQMDKPNGLYPNYLNPKTGKWGTRHTSVGALGDSFYEYLIKSYVITGKRDTEAKELYDAAIKAIDEQLVQKSKSGLVYVAEMKGSRLDHKMDHLACFVGGMFALQAEYEDDLEQKDHFLNLAQEITHTCHESYIRADTHLGPESFRFTNEFEAITVNDREKYYILRPEVIEAYFYMWRITKDSKYREWAWDAAQAIEKYCKSDAGYSGIRNVYNKDPGKDDVQQSFFLAETLKYLYLIFAPDDVISLNDWVLNTEAHPLPVRKFPPGAPSAGEKKLAGDTAVNAFAQELRPLNSNSIIGGGNRSEFAPTPSFRLERRRR